MDRKQLEPAIKAFVALVKQRGYDIQGTFLTEAFPGDSSTSYILEVAADWSQQVGYSATVDILIDALWDSMDVETRRHIFTIKIFDKVEDLTTFEKLRAKYYYAEPY